MMTRLPIVAAMLLCPAMLLCQRDKPTLEWQTRATTIEYGAVPLGRHSLTELQVGATWRLGMNTASVWRTQMPILVGDRLMPPGEYRINLRRLDEARCCVVANGTALALGDGEDIELAGKLEQVSKQAKKLQLEWQKVKGKDKQVQTATLHIRYGKTAWQGSVKLLGGKTSKLGGFKLTVFAVPASHIEGRKQTPVPVAVLTKGKNKSRQAWNLILDEDDARLVPWMKAPTAQFGFGEVKAPPAALSTDGTIAVSEAAGDKPVSTLQLKSASLKKRQITIELVAGKETLVVSLPQPDSKAKK